MNINGTHVHLPCVLSTFPSGETYSICTCGAVKFEGVGQMWHLPQVPAPEEQLLSSFSLVCR